MATMLRVVGSNEKKMASAEPAGPSDEEILKAETDLREEARNLVQEIEHKYWDLGRALYDVYDGVPGGYRGLTGSSSREDRRSLFEKWGYKNFCDYCENEVGIRKRTGENLRFAYYWFAIQQPMPPHVVADLVSIGRSKMYLLSGVATLDSVTLWIEKAKELTFEDLKKAIKTAKAVTSVRNVDTEEKDASGFVGSSAPVEENAPKQPPKPEEFHQVNVPLADAQFDTWKTAFDRAKKLTNSDKTGHNFELICQDFLANNDFSNTQEKDRTAYLAKMERRLGVLIIAIDPNSGAPIHGRDLLWRMIKESGGEAEK